MIINIKTICISVMLLAPLWAKSQHHWLKADQAVAAKKTPVRLNILAGNNMEPKPWSDVPRIERYVLYQAKDSFSLKESGTGTSALVKNEVVKETFLAGATLLLPEKTLLLTDLEKQFTKEQKAIIAQTDTSVLSDGVLAKRYHYVKTIVPVERHTDKAGIYKKQLNHDLEILLTSDPAQTKPGGQVVIQLLLHQRVLPNHKVTVWRKDPGGNVIESETKTNKFGIRLITIPKAGDYVIIASQEGPHKIGLSDDITWKSLEASYSFSIK